MNLEEISDNFNIIKYQNTENVLEDVCTIIDTVRDYAYKSINIALVVRNWLIGYRIAEEELKGNNRADYGKNTINNFLALRNQHILASKEINSYNKSDKEIQYCLHAYNKP